MTKERGTASIDTPDDTKATVVHLFSIPSWTLSPFPVFSFLLPFLMPLLRNENKLAANNAEKFCNLCLLHLSFSLLVTNKHLHVEQNPRLLSPLFDLYPQNDIQYSFLPLPCPLFYSHYYLPVISWTQPQSHMQTTNILHKRMAKQDL